MEDMDLSLTNLRAPLQATTAYRRLDFSSDSTSETVEVPPDYHLLGKTCYITAPYSLDKFYDDNPTRDELVSQCIALGAWVANNVRPDDFVDLGNDPVDVSECPDHFLLCDAARGQAHRSVKFFMALALGIPIVSFDWIHDSFQKGELQDYRAYLLPIFSDPNYLHSPIPQVTHIIAPTQRALCGVKVFLLAEEREPTNFQLEWRDVIEAAGGQVTSKLDYEVFCIVAEWHPLDMENEFAGEVPITSFAWIVQSILCGHPVNPADLALRGKFCSVLPRTPFVLADADKCM